MKNLYFLLCMLVLVGSLGCSHHRAKLSVSGKVVSPLREARVFDVQQFTKGGNLLVVPFSAGTGVAASDDLDRLSLMIVKGIADVLGEDSQRLKLLTTEDAQDADLVIKGRIVDVEQKSTFGKPWGEKPKQLKFAIEGFVLGVEKEDIVAKFAQLKEISGKSVSLENLAYETGLEVGHFLLNAGQ